MIQRENGNGNWLKGKNETRGETDPKWIWVPNLVLNWIKYLHRYIGT